MDDGAIEQRLSNLEKNVDILQKDRDIIVKVDAKQDYIIETIRELKEAVKVLSTPPSQPSTQSTDNGNKIWSPIVIELIKVLTTTITVLGAVAGALKYAGK